jgi:predicted DNA-binding transcriptional regulator YafY
MSEDQVRIYYTNWKGESSWRTVIPRRFYLGAVEWHPGEQYLLDAFDVEKRAMRTFAMEQVHTWVSEATHQRNLKEARELEEKIIYGDPDAPKPMGIIRVSDL